MSPIPITVQFYIKTCSRKEHREGGWIEQKARLAEGGGKR